ncbi:putative membrane protein YagU involved in acid resistance [Paenibacillus shirakamiensis]|uniref:Membrane protein YagU involved in acid resistance n=1 Tax=Paenibacillus shirakamiensis TaxID=1265935 RepID=A0ABS4JCK0_9BACL|nr:YqhR family membrane protein [Paenibacillus shirakamiensis]MBP1999423.1 putative membrane protein YagU involved in acid resistance [Paenibacillus shirakamiensis]
MTQQKTQASQVTNPWWFALELGLFAGLIWGGFHGFFYFLRFTSVLPGFLAEPFFKTTYLKTQPGYYMGWLFFTVFSLVATYIYIFTLRKMKGPWPGLAYGILWWVIIFFIGPMYKMVPPLRQAGWDTIISEFCIFMLWGLFIGYTIAVEYTEERAREPKKVFR